MTNKVVGTKERMHEPEGLPTREYLQIAYQIHTLSQLIYGHLATRAYLPAAPYAMGAYEPYPTFATPPLPHHHGGMWGGPVGMGPLAPTAMWTNPLIGL